MFHVEHHLGQCQLTATKGPYGYEQLASPAQRPLFIPSKISLLPL